ncbi:MAG TPA: PAS domain S-box protein, partial [Allocoleopsis sp.]
FLQNLRVSPNGTVFIVDRTGRMVASSTSEKPFFMGRNNGETEQLKAIESQDPPIRLSMQHLVEQFGELNKINTAQQLQFDIAGKQQFLQITPFQDEFGLDWLIVVTVPESDFMGRIDANTQNTIFTSAAALTGAVLLGLLMARWIARPIQRLSYASRSLATGAWQTALQENSPIAELQVLTHAFNQTAEQLSQTFDRVRTELQESEEKFTTVFRTCPDPMSILTLDGQIVEVNDAFVDLLGYSRAEIIGYQASDIGYWLSAAQQQQYLQALQAGERIRNQEYTFRKKTGELLTVWISTEGIELQGQRCCLEVAKDITDRKQIEAALSQSESRIQRLAAAAPGAIYTLVKRRDESFYFEYISPAIEEINECTVGQMLDHPALDLIHPEDRHDYNRAVAQSAITLQAFSHEFRIITPSGKLKWLQASSRPEQRQNGETAWYGIVLDISDRKRLELALQASEAKLSDIINSPIAAISRIVLFADQHWAIDFLSAGCEAVFG